VAPAGPFRIAAGVSDENSRGKLQNVVANSTADLDTPHIGFKRERQVDNSLHSPAVLR
jgi:hypothetical protein